MERRIDVGPFIIEDQQNDFLQGDGERGPIMKTPKIMIRKQ